MKLTKQQLKQLIKEELQNVLQEGPWMKKRRRRMPGPIRPQGGRSAGGAGEALGPVTLDDIFAELQEIKGLISREMTPAGLGIEGAPQ